jgi:hypothetical protein
LGFGFFLLWFGVGFFSKSTCFHKHKNGVSTWSHAVLVEKNVDATPKQEKKNNAKTK